ncbi:MAG: flagellar basal body P-ring formation chaperone FlgA [Phycisphaerales bacterium]
MTRMIARLVSTLVLVAMGIGAASPALGAADDADITTVRLRSGARVTPGQPVTLADIATIAGPQASLVSSAKLADPLEPDAKAIAVRVDAVLDALREIDGVQRGRLSVTGTSCTVIPKRTPAASPANTRRYDPPAATQVTSLRLRILEHLRALFDVDASAIRAAFDERDDELLDIDVSRLTVEIRTLGGSERLPLSISLYDGDRLAQSATLRVTVQIRREVAVVNQRLDRRDTLQPAHITTEWRWVSAGVNPVNPADAVGRVVRTTLDPGAVIEDSDIERPIHVKRGDITSIRSVVGTAVVRTKARARADGCEGDIIEFEALDRSVRFLARVVGDGRAVIAPETGRVPGAERPTIKIGELTP